jgi:hypothetical protein
VTGSPDDPTKVEAALRVAVDRQMKEKDALKLADWVKQGGKPEDFGQKDSKEPLNDPYAAYWPALGPGIKVKFKGGDTYQIQMTVKGHGETFNAALAASKALNDGKVGKAPRPQEPPNLFGSLKRGILPMKPPNLIGNVLKHAWREGLSAFRNPDRFKDALFGRQGRFAQLGYWLYVLALAWVVFKILAFVWGIVWNLF